MVEKTEFETFALVHIDAVYKMAVALCGNWDQAEDLVQATYLKAFEKFGSFRKGTNCKAWLLKICRNYWIDQIRHKRVAGDVLPIDEDMLVSQADDNEITWSNCQDLLENFSDEQVIRALGDLGDDQRLTLFLIDVEQLSQQEAAEILGVEVGTVKSRTSRARTALKKKLLSYAKEMGYAGEQK